MPKSKTAAWEHRRSCCPASSSVLARIKSYKNSLGKKKKDSCLDFLIIAFVFHTQVFNPPFGVIFVSFPVAVPLQGYFSTSAPNSKFTSAVSLLSPRVLPALRTLSVCQGISLLLFATLVILVSCCGPWGLIPLVFRMPSGFETPMESVAYVLCLCHWKCSRIWLCC